MNDNFCIKHFYTFIAISLLMFCSCESRKQLTVNDAMVEFKKLSPGDGAIFYMKNRESYNFMDKLYGDSIMPALEYCTYYELKDVYGILKKSPYGEEIGKLKYNAREILLSDIYNEISSNMKEEQNIFLNEILPTIELGLDSIANENVNEVTHEYSRGFLNYKKLYFFVGRDEEDFMRIWTEKVRAEKYYQYIIENSKCFLGMLCNVKSSYYKEITGRSMSEEIRFELPDIDFVFNDSIKKVVRDFTDKEVYEMTVSAIKDYAIPTALGVASFGIGTILYECGNTIYDVKTVYDDIKDGKMSADDLLKLQCESYINEQLSDKYLQEYRNNILKEIYRINNKLYNSIEFSL